MVIVGKISYGFGGQRVGGKVCFSECIGVVALAVGRSGVESVGTGETAGGKHFGGLSTRAFGTGALEPDLEGV